MEAFLWYSGKMILCSGVMFLYYQLFLKDKTFHHYNRFYLIALMLVSLLLPLVKIDFFTIEINKDLYLLYSKLQNFNNIKATNDDTINYQYFIYAFGLVSVFFVGRLIYGIIRIQNLKKIYHQEIFKGIRFYQTNLTDAPFSYFKNLFWKESIIINSDLGRQILKHEMVHIEQKHTYDKLWSEVVVAVFWFNPFFHIIKKELGLIHEYLADKKSVKNSDTKAFAQMLLASHFSGKVLPATSPFLSSNLKKRLQMLQQPKTKYSYARRLLALPTTFILAFAYMVNAQNNDITQTNKDLEVLVESMDQPVVIDTIKNNKLVDSLMTLQSKRVAAANDKVKKQNDKIEKLAAENTKKVNELKKVQEDKGVDSKEYQEKIKELSKIGKELEKLSENNFGFNIVDLNWDAKEFQQLKELKGFDWTEIQKQSKNFAKGFDFSDISKIDFDSIYKMAESHRISAEDSRKYAEQILAAAKDNPWVMNVNATKKSELSKKEQKKLAELNKKQAELRKKQAEVAKEKAEILRKKSQNFENSFSYTTSFPAVPQPPKNINAILVDDTENVTFYLNGKVIDKKTFEMLKPEDIESININKSNKDGKKYGEIHVKTKK